METPASALSALEASLADVRAELEALVRIPSVSAEGFPAAEVERSAEAVAALLRRRGFPQVELLRVDGSHPYVLAERIEAPALPTVLLYAHHDVQPPGDLAAWGSPPFEPTERDGRLHGRGAADDKAGVVALAAAVDAWVRGAGRLPVNVRLLVDGEEEIGSEHLGALLARHGERLRADALVVADTGNLEVGVPCLTIALRGLVTVDVEVRALEQSLHSGIWGGPVPDPAMALAKVLATLVDGDGRIAVPGVTDAVRPLSPAQRATIAALRITPQIFARLARLRPGVSLVGGGNPVELTWWEPSLAVNALQSSSRAGARDVVNDAAWARVGIRLVPDMDPADVAARLDRALREAAPWGVEVETRVVSASAPWSADVSHPAFAAGLRALEAGYGRRALAVGCGASIPFVAPLAAALGGVPALLVGVEDPASRAHSEDESVDLADLARAIRASVHLLGELGEALRPR
jgi:acetylornithine deacetylase/succinyl-diaminopimelate desuccinylase-like protein